MGTVLLKCLKTRDANGIAAMVPQEELDDIGVSRQQAAMIIREEVLPKAGEITRDTQCLTVAGSYLTFEKPRADIRYFMPPMIYMVSPSPGEHAVSLTYLLNSVWAMSRVDAVLGLYDGDWHDAQRKGIAKAKSLGMLKAMDWSGHLARLWPSQRPVTG